MIVTSITEELAPRKSPTQGKNHYSKAKANSSAKNP